MGGFSVLVETGGTKVCVLFHVENAEKPVYKASFRDFLTSVVSCEKALFSKIRVIFMHKKTAPSERTGRRFFLAIIISSCRSQG